MGLMTDAQANDALYQQNTDEYGETVTYTPTGASAVSIVAIVDRNPPERLIESSGDVLSNHLEMWILSDATAGLSSPPSPGRDSVSLPRRVGESARSMTVGHIIEQDTNGWLVAVR